MKEKGLAPVFLDSRLEHPARVDICARYKSSVLLLMRYAWAVMSILWSIMAPTTCGVLWHQLHACSVLPLLRTFPYFKEISLF